MLKVFTVLTTHSYFISTLIYDDTKIIQYSSYYYSTG